MKILPKAQHIHSEGDYDMTKDQKDVAFERWLDTPQEGMLAHLKHKLRRECFSNRVIEDFRIGWDAHAALTANIAPTKVEKREWRS